MDLEEYISVVNGKFSIDRVFNDKNYNFGMFDSYDDALDKLDYLEEEGWPIPINSDNDDNVDNDVVDDYGRPLNNIEEIDGKFIVFKYINNEKVIFDELDSVEDAKQIRENLILNAWESCEPNTRSKYAKYIKKIGSKFVVNRIYEGKSHNFGYFDTFEEALDQRDDLISNNWGKLNIPHKMKYGKYISFNGIMYTIQKVLNNTVHVYGFFNELDDAIKQRDWLMDNNWSKLEVPDDSKRYIHKNGDKFFVYKNLDDDLEFYGEFDSFEEAKQRRNELIVNDWVLVDNSISNIEKISDFVYFDGEFYIIEKEFEGQKRIYGIYKNKNRALSDEKSFIIYDWDAPYSIPTEEYPYGENIVPFDYIFILEKNINGVKEEIGTFHTFQDVVIARDKLLSEDVNKLVFSVKVGKSYKNRGWSIIRDTTYDLIPKLPYEDDCDIIVDGIPTKGKLNLLPRIFYDKNETLVNHLKELADTNPNDRVDVELLLNKEIKNDLTEYDKLYDEYLALRNTNLELESSIKELKEILIYMDDENRQYLTKFNNIVPIINELAKIEIPVDEMSQISNADLRIKIFDIFDNIKLLKDNID